MKNFTFLYRCGCKKYVKNEKRYKLINFICLLAVYKKLIGTGRVLGTSILRYEAVDGRPTWTDCDEAGDYVVPNVLSPRDLVFRPDNMDETVLHTHVYTILC